MGVNPRAVIAVDLNGDGRLDLAVANHDSNTLTILMGRSDGTFAPGVDYLAGQGPVAAAAGDFNRDGAPDIAVANSAGQTISIFTGNGDGTLQSFAVFPAGPLPQALAAGDFNRDGKLDLAIAVGGTPGGAAVLPGNGDGSFQPQRDFAAGDAPAAILADDFNGDGVLDLAVANRGSSTVSILAGKGDGTFQTHADFAVDNGPVSLAAGDFSGDGLTDLAVASHDSPSISLLLAGPGGTFQTGIGFYPGMSPVFLIAGDFNADGLADLALAGNVDSQGQMAILLGNGSGDFLSQGPIDLISRPAALAAGDFTGDGALDLALADQDTRSVTVLVGQAGGAFPSPADYRTGSTPTLMASADFNRDGEVDLATSNWGSANVSVLLGNGDGTFQAGADFPVHDSPFGIAAGDFNRDGRPDLVVTSGLDSGFLSVLLGNGDGTFQPRRDTAFSVQMVGVFAADFNADGNLDVAMMNGGFTRFHVAVLLGNGDGTFHPSGSFPIDQDPVSGVAADFNRDGRIDIATGSTNNSTISILLGNGDGTFQTHREYSSGYTPYSLAAADFNRDGNPDLVTANSGSASVSVFLGNGDGTFRRRVDYPTGYSPESVTTGDFDGDGKLDLAVSNTFAHTVSFLPGNGDGTFGAHVDFAAGIMPEGSIRGDFNHDGGADLAVAHKSDDSVRVFLNSAVAAFYPTRLNFADRPVGTASPAQVVLISNPGSMPLLIADIATGGDFAQSNTCGASLAVGTSCKISVTFSPTDTGSRAGALVISDGAASSPQQISLSGNGTGPAPVASLSATSLVFSSPAAGTSSPPQTVILTNTGNLDLNITGISIAGASRSDFAQSNNCGAVLGIGAACGITVTFTPAAAPGTESATLVIADDAADSPQAVALRGMLAGSVATYSPLRLYFPSQPVGTASAALPVVVKISGTQSYSIQSISASGDFSQTNNCATTVAGNGGCTINVTFKPSGTGDRAGNLVVYHLGTPSVTGLYGQGGDFSLSAPVSSATIAAGDKAVYNLYLTPMGGFNRQVTLSCAGAPEGASCWLPESTALDGVGTGAFDVEIRTRARSAVAPPPGAKPLGPSVPPATWLLAALCLLAFLGFAWAFTALRAAGESPVAAALRTTALLLVLAGAACGGGGGAAGGGSGGGGTPNGTYSIVVTVTYASGSVILAHSVSLKLTVN